jgi:hypothetical protein
MCAGTSEEKAAVGEKSVGGSTVMQRATGGGGDGHKAGKRASKKRSRQDRDMRGKKANGTRK